MTYITLKWQNSTIPANRFFPCHTCVTWQHRQCLSPLKSQRQIVTEYNFFFREQLNSLLKTYNIFYENQENLHISYGQVSPSKKCNIVDSLKKKNPIKVQRSQDKLESIANSKNGL